MKVLAIFDMVSTEYEIEVPDGSTAAEAEAAVYGWLEAHLGEVADDIRESEIWVSSIEEAGDEA